MKITQKELKRLAASGAAVDVSNITNEEMEALAKGRDDLAFSYGTYGCNGALFSKGGALYVVIGRVGNLWHVMA